MGKYSFSGHESFVCKQFWLKKGYDFLKNEKKFVDETAVVNLGVGKNMVTSIRFWLKSFGLYTENDQLNEIAEFIFDEEKGRDPFLEDLGTQWLLHYLLVKTNKSSIYNLVFNEFRKEKIDFTKDHLHSFLKRKCIESDTNVYNSNTVNSDINVFLRNYVKPRNEEKIEVEEDYSSILIDLELVRHYRQKNPDDNKIVDWYKIEGEIRNDLPCEIVLYSILDTMSLDSTITFKDLLINPNSPGLIFALNADGLYNKIKEIEEKYKQIVYTETAGNQVIQFKSKIDKLTILNDYYQK